jgi:hypothetical protein
MWRIDQLTDGSYRIAPKSMPERPQRWCSAAGSAVCRPWRGSTQPAIASAGRWITVTGIAVKWRVLGVVSICLPGRRAAPAELPAARPRRLRSLTPSATQRVDERGFIHRWLVLEPAPVPGRLTELRGEGSLQLAALPENADAQRIDGGDVTVNGTALSGMRWKL